MPLSLYGACHQIIPEFLERYPGVNIQLISNEGALDLIADSIDIGIRITYAPPLGLVARKLFPVEILVCAADRPVHPSALAVHSCIHFSDISESQTWSMCHRRSR
ncbi:transcriptional regulator [compost metagenome]